MCNAHNAHALTYAQLRTWCYTRAYVRSSMITHALHGVKPAAATPCAMRYTPSLYAYDRDGSREAALVQALLLRMRESVVLSMATVTL